VNPGADSVEGYHWTLPVTLNRIPSKHECWCIRGEHHPFAILIPDDQCPRHNKEK